MADTETEAEKSDPSQNLDSKLASQGLIAKAPLKQEPTEREVLLDRMDRQIEEQRVRDEEAFYQSGDPRAVMLAAEMGREARGEKIRADSSQGREESSEEAAPVEQEADTGETGEEDAATAEAAKAVRVSTKGVDPLAEYIVRENGKAMFKTVIDGKSHLIPVEKARATLQQHLAADIRFRQAAERQVQLDARERQIQATEATLKARASQREATPIVDDAALDVETADLVRALVSKPEAEAAKQMSALMRKVRQAPAPQIDIDAIVGVAVLKAKQEFAAENEQRALESGLNEFTKTYPDIAADSELFATADRKTTAIAQEHPEWNPGKVMLEAGRQTRVWLKSLGVVPGESPSQPNRRQEAKSKLTPMPASRISRPPEASGKDPNAPDDPAAYLAAIREKRGAGY